MNKYQFLNQLSGELRYIADFINNRPMYFKERIKTYFEFDYNTMKDIRDRLQKAAEQINEMYGM